MGDPFLQPDSELVLGLVAPVGADLDAVESILEDRLAHFRYTPKVVRLSRLIRELDELDVVEEPAADRYNSYMTAGNKARESSGRGDFLALSAIYQVQGEREADQAGRRAPIRRRAHILRSLKHPDEVRTLRRVYGAGFFLIGVHATREVRRSYLANDKNISEPIADALLDRDEDEGNEFGQRTRDTFELCDAFVSLHAPDHKEQLWRVLDLLFAKPDVTPSKDEYAMYLAYAASLRSRDLSRQVGAVITSEPGEIVATGANDVPKNGGGLYWADDAKRDCRDWKRGFDSNERERNAIAARLIRGLLGEEGDDLELIRAHQSELEKSGLMDLTEFGRAVHAEMEAMLSCARSGVSPRGGTLYSTTFPCHNCAKHIVAAGIARVVYVEPYPKSRADELHDDALTLEGEQQKVRFEPFVGIGPRRFIDLFSMQLSSGSRVRRKKKNTGGDRVDWDRNEAELRVPMAALSYLEREQLATKTLNDALEARQ